MQLQITHLGDLDAGLCPSRNPSRLSVTDGCRHPEMWRPPDQSAAEAEARQLGISSTAVLPSSSAARRGAARWVLSMVRSAGRSFRTRANDDALVGTRRPRNDLEPKSAHSCRFCPHIVLLSSAVELAFSVGPKLQRA